MGRAIARWTMALVFVVVVGACGGSDDRTTTSAVSPFEEFFGFGGQAQDQDHWNEQNRRAEALIVDCMVRQGFDYVPGSLGPTAAPASTTPEGVDLESLNEADFAERYGFGISTLAFQDDLAWQDSVGSYEDPNAEYLDSISNDEREAYERALWGQFEGYDETMSEEELEAELEGTALVGEGCYGEAWGEVFGHWQVLEDLTSEFEELEDRFSADPRVQQFSLDWSACMAEAGHTISSPEEMLDEVWAKMDALYEEGSRQGPELSEDEYLALSEEELEQLFDFDPGYDPDKIAEIQDYERAVAVASVGCGFGRDELQGGLLSEIRNEYEQEFLDTHRDELQAFADGQSR